MLIYVYFPHQLSQTRVDDRYRTFPVRPLRFSATQCFAVELKIPVVQSSSQSRGLGIQHLPAQI